MMRLPYPFLLVSVAEDYLAINKPSARTAPNRSRSACDDDCKDTPPSH